MLHAIDWGSLGRREAAFNEIQFNKAVYDLCDLWVRIAYKQGIERLSIITELKRIALTCKELYKMSHPHSKSHYEIEA